MTFYPIVTLEHGKNSYTNDTSKLAKKLDVIIESTIHKVINSVSARLHATC